MMGGGGAYGNMGASGWFNSGMGGGFDPYNSMGGPNNMMGGAGMYGNMGGGGTEGGFGWKRK